MAIDCKDRITDTPPDPGLRYRRFVEASSRLFSTTTDSFERIVVGARKGKSRLVEDHGIRHATFYVKKCCVANGLQPRRSSVKR